MNKLFTKIVGAALGLTMAIGVGVAVGASRNEAQKVDAAVNDETTLFDVTNKSNWGTSNASYSATEWTDEKQLCTFAYAANNNKGWTYVRMGGKNVSTSADSYIKCNTATTTLTSAVKVTVAQAKSNANLTLNSVKLFVYSNSTFTTQVDEVTYDLSDYSAKEITFNPSSTYTAANGSNWAIGSYFKYVVNWTNSANKNYGTDISKIVAVEGAAASSSNCAMIELTNYPTSDFGIGDTAQLGYTAIDDQAESWSGDVIYSSSDTNVATVSASGLLTAVGVGTTTVSVQDKDGNASADSHLVTVVANYFYPVTSQDDLINGAKVVIVGKSGGNYYAMNDTITSYKPGAVSATVTTYSGKNVVVPSSSLITWTVGINGDSFTLLSNNSKYLRGYVYNNTTPEIVTSATSSNTGNTWTLSVNSTAGYNLVSDANVYAYLLSTSSFDGASSEQSEGVYLYQLCKGTPTVTKVVPSTDAISVNTASGDGSFTFTLHPSYASGTATAVSGDASVATVSTNSTTVTVTPVGNGSTTITFKDGSDNALTGSVSVTSTIVVSYDSLRVEGVLGGAPYYVGDEITATELSNITVYGVKAGEEDTLLESGYTLTSDPNTLDESGSVQVTVTATYDADPSITGSKQFNITVNEKPYAAKATSLDDLWDGQLVYFGNNSDRAWPHWSTGNNIQATAGTGTYNENKGLSINDSSGDSYLVGRVYDADASTTYYTFSYENGGDTYYLSSTASGSNSMKGVTSFDNSCYWTIVAGANSGQWSIQNVKNTTRYMQTNGNYLSCYTNSQTNPYLYVTTTYSVDEVAESFKQNALHFADYDSSKTTEDTEDGAGWCSDDEHGYYAHAKKVWNAMKATERAAADVDTLARLSAWASANGDVLNGTNVLSARISPISIIAKEGNTTAVIVIISMVSLTAIGAYFFIRKRKEQ